MFGISGVQSAPAVRMRKLSCSGGELRLLLHALGVGVTFTSLTILGMSNPDSFYFEWQSHSFCEKCARYYNPAIQHICVMEDISLTRERKKLERWLGDEWKIIE